MTGRNPEHHHVPRQTSQTCPARRPRKHNSGYGGDRSRHNSAAVSSGHRAHNSIAGTTVADPRGCGGRLSQTPGVRSGRGQGAARSEGRGARLGRCVSNIVGALGCFSEKDSLTDQRALAGRLPTSCFQLTEPASTAAGLLSVRPSVHVSVLLSVAAPAPTHTSQCSVPVDSVSDIAVSAPYKVRLSHFIIITIADCICAQRAFYPFWLPILSLFLH